MLKNLLINGSIVIWKSTKGMNLQISITKDKFFLQEIKKKKVKASKALDKRHQGKNKKIISLTSIWNNFRRREFHGNQRVMWCLFISHRMILNNFEFRVREATFFIKNSLHCYWKKDVKKSSLSTSLTMNDLFSFAFLLLISKNKIFHYSYYFVDWKWIFVILLMIINKSKLINVYNIFL